MATATSKPKKKVSFGMFYEVYGRQTIDLPDDIDENDTEAIKAYIQKVWDEIPLPSDGSYVSGSDGFDTESAIEVFTDEMNDIQICSEPEFVRDVGLDEDNCCFADDEDD